MRRHCISWVEHNQLSMCTVTLTTTVTHSNLVISRNTNNTSARSQVKLYSRLSHPSTLLTRVSNRSPTQQQQQQIDKHP